MTEQRFDLLTEGGMTVTWTGTHGPDAATRFAEIVRPRTRVVSFKPHRDAWVPVARTEAA